MKSMTLVILFLFVASGCDDGKSVAKSAGSRVGETVTDFASGIGEGVDKRMEVTLDLSPKCADLGLSKTVAKSLGLKEGISVYVISERPVSGQLVCRAINEGGDEVGRSKVDVEFEADDAQYVTFTFDTEMDTQLVKKYLVDLRVPTDSEASAEKATPDSASEGAK